MKPFFVSLALHDVHHLKNLLESAGIGCRLKNEGLSTLAGEVPFTECTVQLFLLSEDDRPEADAVLRAWRAGPPRGPAWTCTACGESLEHQFTTCWQCGRERNAPASS